MLLLALRILQGAAVGGEVPSAWVFIAEHAPSGHRGFALGMLQAGLTFGYLLGALTAAWLARVYTPEQMLDHGWRVPFILGGVFGLLGVWLRRWLSETPVFIALQARRAADIELPLRTVLREHRTAILPALLLTCLLTSAVVVLVVITPTVMQKRFGLPPEQTFALSSLGIVFLNIGCVLAGRMADRLGAWRALAIHSALLPLGVLALYGCLILELPLTGPAYALAGLCCGVVGVVPSIMVGLFPAHIRVSGISVTYNIAYALWASVIPLLLIVLMPWSAWSVVIFSALVGLAGLCCVRVFGRSADVAALASTTAGDQ